MSDIETTLSVTDNDVKNIINGDVPTIKDFHRISMMWEGVEWECPLLMKKIAKDVEQVMQKYNDNYIAENIIGMRCMYREALSRGHLIFGLYLYDKNGQNFNIRGIGSTTEGISPMNAKKLILKICTSEYINSIFDSDIPLLQNFRKTCKRSGRWRRDFRHGIFHIHCQIFAPGKRMIGQ